MQVDRVKANMRCSVKVGDIFVTIELGAEGALSEEESRDWAHWQHLLWASQKEQLVEKITGLRHDAKAQADAKAAKARNGSAAPARNTEVEVSKPATQRQIDALKKNGVHEIPSGLTVQDASAWLQRIWDQGK